MRMNPRIRLLLVSLIFFMILGILFINIDEKVMPAALAVAELRAQTDINEVIQHSVRNIIEEMRLITADFYKKEGDAFIVDTVLINHFCNNVAADISHKLSNMQEQKILIPSGTLTGIRALSNYGPNFSIIVKPTGSVTVDYDSSFSSAGINQVNFQIWLNVESAVRIVNPLQSKNIDVSRKIPLVDTVIVGEVPPFYMDGR